MFCNILNLFYRTKNRAGSARPRSSTSPRIEELESRWAPSGSGLYPDQTPPYTTVTNASVQIIPNLASMTVTEKVTATVSNAPEWTGVYLAAVPPGTPNPNGNVHINLNNQQRTLSLDSNGQATTTFTIPLFGFMTPQELTVQYLGGYENPSGVLTYRPSYFNAPLYMNFDNALLPANLTFTPLSSQQTYLGSGSLPPYTSANGETDDFGLFSFLYADPGIIESMQILGLQLPGIFAAELGAFGSQF